MIRNFFKRRTCVTIYCLKTIIMMLNAVIKRGFCLFVALMSIGVLLAQQPSTAHTLQSIPDPKRSATGYVSNPDGVLSSAEVQHLNQQIAQMESALSVQIAVVLVNSIGNQDPKDFSTRLFETWGIGYQDKDNGLLIFTVMDQRRTEFETGYGLEGVLPDISCYRIGMQELVPHFREGNYAQGISATLARMQEVMSDPESREYIRSNREIPDSEVFLDILSIYIVINLIFHLIIGLVIFLTLRSKQDFYDKYMQVKKYTLSFIWMIFFPLLYIPVYFLIKKLLHRLRNAPRFSPVNGRSMIKLDEELDDQFLEAGQVTEEEVGSVDYDVWITDDADDVLILRYAKRFSKYSNCPKCGYKTYYHARTETIMPATYSNAGKGRKIYTCKNCDYFKEDYFSIPRKQRTVVVTTGGGGGGGGFSGGGFGGSRSWGGGASGGGGAGVNW